MAGSQSGAATCSASFAVDHTGRIANLEGALNQQQQGETLLAQIVAAGEREASLAIEDADFSTGSWYASSGASAIATSSPHPARRCLVS
jgi:hypothetical protein